MRSRSNDIRRVGGVGGRVVTLSRTARWQKKADKAPCPYPYPLPHALPLPLPCHTLSLALLVPYLYLCP